MSETIHIQAPAGGGVSIVNGQWYKGGQWMPESGLCCGAKRSAKKWAKPTHENWCEIAVENNFPRVRAVHSGQYGQRIYRTFFLTNKPFQTKEETMAFCNEVVRLRSEAYQQSGCAPHPTEIVERLFQD